MIWRTCDLLRLPVLVIVLHLIAGCTSHPAPITSREQPPGQRIDFHRVAPGDTLYSIAWRYDLDYRKLAFANRIKPPYTLHPGQKLMLDTSKVVAPSKLTPRNKPQRPKSNKSVNAQKTTATQHKSVKASKPPEVQQVSNKNLQWKWPIKGSVVKAFNPNKLHKGVSIKALSQSVVRAAAPGTVVYAGDGLRGYGKLIIIKHNELMLSAYAHNEKIMVKEGQVVKSMEVISRLGRKGTLYFEIRKDGYPVNPVTYLR